MGTIIICLVQSTHIIKPNSVVWFNLRTLENNYVMPILPSFFLLNRAQNSPDAMDCQIYGILFLLTLASALPENPPAKPSNHTILCREKIPLNGDKTVSTAKLIKSEDVVHPDGVIPNRSDPYQGKTPQIEHSKHT